MLRSLTLITASPYAAAPASEPDPAAAETAATAAFCLTVYGLCWCLAAGRLDETVAIAPDEDLDGDEGEVDDAEPDTDASLPSATADRLAVEFSDAVSATAQLLSRALPSRDGETDASARPSHGEVRLVAKALLQCLLPAMQDAFLLEEPRLEAGEEHPLTRQRIVVRAPDLAPRIERLLTELPYRFTVQPLISPPRYRDDVAAAGDDELRFRIPLIGYRRTNGFLGRFLGATLKRRDSSFSFSKYVEAVDLQQAVPWRINTALLRHARCLAALVGDPEAWPEDVRSELGDPGLDEQAVKAWQTWIADNFYRATSSARKSYQKPAEFLDSLLARTALADLARPGDDGAPRRFYLPWKADYRGRIYAETPWLTPQGGDLQRALFEFANGRPLDEAGVKALRRHGANLARRARVIGDLSIAGRQVLTLEERERWILMHEVDICRSAEAPLVHTFWRDAASKPMQFLAFCLAYRRWKADPNVHIHLPVQIDGTCNGLQHIAALTGDAKLAQAVNVVPRDDGLPGDIYSEVAAAAQATVGHLENLLNHAKWSLPEEFRRAMIWADKVLASRQDWRAWLDRGTAKAVVMTVPYGASPGAQARRVLEVIEVHLEDVAPGHEAWPDPATWIETLLADQKTQKLVATCARGRFKSLWRRDGDKARDHVRALGVLGTALAWVIVIHLLEALKREFPVADSFGTWLKEVAKCCSGLPLMWITPLGLPVCQDKFRQRRSTLNARLGARKVSIGITHIEEQIDEGGQGRALLPNLIHSLDATHLAMTFGTARENGITDIGTIHDCLLCHPNDADPLGVVVRQTFATLYDRSSNEEASPDVLKGWVRWMHFVARLAAIPNPNMVLGALDNPDGLGEMWLQRRATQTEEDDSRAALSILGEIRSFDPARRALARMLLEYACEVPICSDMRDGGRKKRQPCRKQHPLDPRWPVMPDAGSLALGHAVSSEYFFC